MTCLVILTAEVHLLFHPISMTSVSQKYPIRQAMENSARCFSMNEYAITSSFTYFIRFYDL